MENIKYYYSISAKYYNLAISYKIVLVINELISCPLIKLINEGVWHGLLGLILLPTALLGTMVEERQDSSREVAEVRVMKQTAGKEPEGLQAGNRARGSQEEISRAASKNEQRR